MGFKGLEDKAKEKLSALDFTDPLGVDKIPFYKAIIITCEAVRNFAKRYSELANKLAKGAEEKRRKELLAIAEICDNVPYNPPKTFREAVQTIFFIQLIVHIESDGTGISLGRLEPHLISILQARC